jgi:hypothetical protein
MNPTSILNSVKSEFDNDFETSMKSRIVTSLPPSNEVVQQVDDYESDNQEEEVTPVLDTKSKKSKSKQSLPQKVSQQAKLTEASVLPTSPSDSTSWWIAPLEDGEIQPILGADVLLGFYANDATSFTFNYGYTHEKHSLAKDKIKHAYHSDVLPLIGYEVQKCSISNLSGSGYLVYATLDQQQRVSFRNA